MAVDFSTPVGQVRALIPDIEKVPNPNDPYGNPEYIFADDHLEAFLGLNDGDVYLAAADACEALGTSEAYIAKVITTEDLQTDGAKLMDSFTRRARHLRDRANEKGEGSFFDVTPYHVPRQNRHYWIGGF